MTREEAIKELSVTYLGDSERIIQAKKIAIKSLEQEPILDKIRAEIEARLCDVVSDYTDGYRTAIQGVLNILDKYNTAESEENNG